MRPTQKLKLAQAKREQQSQLKAEERVSQEEKTQASIQRQQAQSEAVKGYIEQLFNNLTEVVTELAEKRYDDLQQIVEAVKPDASVVKRIEELKQSITEGIKVTNLSEAKSELPKIPAPQKVVVKTQKVEFPSWMKQQVDVFDIYKPADTDEDKDSEKYYGFIAASGKWFVMREMGSKNKNFRYAVGDMTYRQGWSGRRALDYRLFNEIPL